MSNADCLHRVVGPIGPEAQRPPQRQLTVERELVVGQGQLRSLNAAALCPEQPSRKPDEARLATPVRARDVQRLPRLKHQIETLEQQPPASAEGHVLEPQQRGHSASSSSACMSSSEKPK